MTTERYDVTAGDNETTGGRRRKDGRERGKEMRECGNKGGTGKERRRQERQ